MSTFGSTTSMEAILLAKGRGWVVDGGKERYKDEAFAMDLSSIALHHHQHCFREAPLYRIHLSPIPSVLNAPIQATHSSWRSLLLLQLLFSLLFLLKHSTAIILKPATHIWKPAKLTWKLVKLMPMHSENVMIFKPATPTRRLSLAR